MRGWRKGATPAADERAAGLDLDTIFDPTHFTHYAREIVGRLDEIA